MIFIFAIQSFLLLVCSPSETYAQTSSEEFGMKNASACDGSELNITCTKNERIHIMLAVYAHFPEDDCNDNNKSHVPIRCISSNSQPIVQRLCSGKAKCTVSASINVFGDPCHGISKSLRVLYQCYSDVGVNTSLVTMALVGNELAISCKESERIHIENAIFYGERDGREFSNNSMPIVQRLCSEKSTCTVHVTNNVFGIQGNDTKRILVVVHWCYSACSSHCAFGCNLNGAGKCDRCDFRFGLTANGSCDACSSNCLAGCNETESGKCDLCDPGYGMTINGSCGPCSANCLAGCNATGAGKCDQCDPGYGLAVSGSCELCSAHCAVGCNMTGAGKCDLCDDGFGLTANGSCDACSSNCSAGCNETGAGKCDLCDPGYGMTINESCGPCSSHCAFGCNLNGVGKCDRCDFRFGLTANGSCDACSANCSAGCNAKGAGKCDQCDPVNGFSGLLGIGVSSCFIIIVLVIIVAVLCVEIRSLRRYKREMQNIIHMPLM